MVQDLGEPIGREEMARLRYENERKSPGIAYFLWFVLGAFGAHRLYLGRPVSAVTLMLVTLLGIATGVLLFVTLAWVLVDLLLIPGMARGRNEAILERIQGGTRR